MADAGAKDQPITLQRKTRTPDGGGGFIDDWADFATTPDVWANVIAKAGREGLDEGRTNATFTVLFTIYNRSDVTELDRIVWQGVTYNIRGIRREGEQALDLVIEAERGVAS